MMDDLITWLREQLDKDEVDSQFIHMDNCKAVVHAGYLPCNCGVPARVLAEVDAKRRLLDWLVDCENKALDGNWWNLEVEDAVKALALPYADRPGYRDEWKP